MGCDGLAPPFGGRTHAVLAAHLPRTADFHCRGSRGDCRAGGALDCIIEQGGDSHAHGFTVALSGPFWRHRWIHTRIARRRRFHLGRPFVALFGWSSRRARGHRKHSLGCITQCLRESHRSCTSKACLVEACHRVFDSRNYWCLSWLGHGKTHARQTTAHLVCDSHGCHRRADDSQETENRE